MNYQHFPHLATDKQRIAHFETGFMIGLGLEMHTKPRQLRGEMQNETY
jgi:hypothetical protein